MRRSDDSVGIGILYLVKKEVTVLNSIQSKIAVMEFGELACVSLLPKSAVAHHYIEKYKMNLTGRTLSLEVPEVLDLINKYDNDKK